MGTHSDLVLIQKPQDLNYPLIETFCRSKGLSPLVKKSFIHDHYRNKDVVPALFAKLPEAMYRNGMIKRLMFFLTESKNVNSELSRFGSLSCGMVQDLGVHMFDLLIETLIHVDRWKCGTGEADTLQRIQAEIEIRKVVVGRQSNCLLPENVETFAAIDVSVTEWVRFSDAASSVKPTPRHIDALIVVGKGFDIEQHEQGDLKSVVVEFENEEERAVIDLKNLAFSGLSVTNINTDHGGMSRPLFLLDPAKCPKHASVGYGGWGYPQFQAFDVGRRVAELANGALQFNLNARNLPAYEHKRALGDFLRRLATEGRIRGIWDNLPPLTKFRVLGQSEPTKYD